jgi:hypothetical protein
VVPSESFCLSFSLTCGEISLLFSKRYRLDILLLHLKPTQAKHNNLKARREERHQPTHLLSAKKSTVALAASSRLASIRLGVASAPANKDVDACTTAPGYVSPGWIADSRPVFHLLLPLPFPIPSPPFHLRPSILHLITGRF